MNNPYYQEPLGILYQGNVLEILRSMPNESVDCIITSPPYWALRDYQLEPQIWDGDEKCKHKWGENIKIEKYKLTTNPGKEEWFKGKANPNSVYNFCLKCNAWRGSLGLEPTFELYLQHLLQIFDEIKRVLKKTGTCWVNIGDSYSGSGCGSWNAPIEIRGKQYRKCLSIDQEYLAPPKKDKSISTKSLCLIPQRFAIEMVNRGWILRNIIIWYKRNCMPSSVKDRFTVDYEPIFFFVKNKKYWFEQQYEEHQWKDKDNLELVGKKCKMQNQFNNPISWVNRKRAERYGAMGRNKRCVWDIPTQPFKDAHFAVFPEKLCEIPIKSGCPEFVCKKCGKAREKIYKIVGKESSNYLYPNAVRYDGQEGINRIKSVKRKGTHSFFRNIKSNGIYTDCGCNADFEGGIVLDPFVGAGTTCVVAKKLGRRFIGIDLKKEYLDMAIKRLKEIPERLFT